MDKRKEGSKYEDAAAEYLETQVIKSWNGISIHILAKLTSLHGRMESLYLWK